MILQTFSLAPDVSWPLSIAAGAIGLGLILWRSWRLIQSRRNQPQGRRNSR